MLNQSVSAARMGSWSIDTESKTLYASARFKEIWGYGQDEDVPYDSAVSNIRDDYREMVDQAVNAAISKGESYDLEYPIIRKSDQQTRWVRAIGRLFSADDDLKANFSGMIIDITEQIEIRQAIEESEDRFRSMAEGSGILIGVGDETGDVTYFNHAWTKLTGKTLENLLAFGWSDIIHPDDKAAYINLYMTSLANRVPYTGEYRILSVTGEYRWLLAFASPRFKSDGSFAGYIGSFIDITERKQDEQRKNDFIGMVSHELKTPVTSINGYVQILQGRAKKAEDDFSINILVKASNQVKKMTTMINGFLNVSRLESGKIYINKQVFDMAELVKEAEEESISTISSHKVLFAPVDKTIVMADRDKIGQVISNLISNAVKYSPNGSTINISCVIVNSNALFSVKDEGMGIDSHDVDRLFERYYRVDSKNMTSISGFGIGLYLCSEIIQRHNGNIGVESALGQGSNFWFTLPIAQAPPGHQDDLQTAPNYPKFIDSVN